MKYLDSNLILNAHEAEGEIKQILDPRERALVRLVVTQTVFAMGLEGAKTPDTPVDLLYIIQLGRILYKERKLLDGILNGNPDDYLWGEED